MGIVIKYPQNQAHARASEGCLKPKRAGSTLLGNTASEKIRKYSGGTRPRAFQLEGALVDSKPAMEQTRAGPPSSAKRSSMDDMIFITHRDNSRSVSASSPHGFGLAKTCGPGPSLAAMYSKSETAKRLVQTQEALELTNAAISEKLGVASNAWSQYRTGDRTIPHSVLVGLKEQFGVSSDWILAGDPSGLPQRLYAKIRIAA